MKYFIWALLLVGAVLALPFLADTLRDGFPLILGLVVFGGALVVLGNFFKIAKRIGEIADRK